MDDDESDPNCRNETDDSTPEDYPGWLSTDRYVSITRPPILVYELSKRYPTISRESELVRQAMRDAIKYRDLESRGLTLVDTLADASFVLPVRIVENDAGSEETDE